MADDQTGSEGGSIFQGKPIAGVPRPVAVGGVILLGTVALVWWWHRKSKSGASSSSTNTVITGSSSTGVDAAMLDAILKNWQQHPASTSSSTGTGTGGGSGSGGGSGGGQGGSSATSTPPTLFQPGGPGTTTDESGNMHGITLAQAVYLFDTGNKPYVFNPATGQYTRWNGMPVAGQTFYAGPMNWQDTLKNGNITGGSKGHPTYKQGTAPKPAPAPAKAAPKPAAKK